MNKVTPEPSEILPQELESIKKRFFAKVDKNGPMPAHKPELGRCWNWTASKGWTGYANFHIKSPNEQRANRASWIIHFGLIPEGQYVLHKCDNRQCTNPEHLFLGTQKENVSDMKSKGRESNRKGIANGRAKLTEENVREIKSAIAAKSETLASLARRFGVAEGMIGFIKRGEAWAHVV